MIIDMHTHLADKRIYPDYWNDNVKRSIAEKFRREMHFEANDGLIEKYVSSVLNDFDCEKKVKLMDQNDVERCVILQGDFGFGKKSECSIEEITEIHYEALNRYRDRFLIFSGIDPRRGKEGLALFRKSIEDYGFAGFKVYPPCGFEINDERLYPFYEICNHYKLPVLIHIGKSWSDMKTTFDYPASILEVSQKFSDVPFILGHAALLFFDESYRLPQERDNIYLEVSGYQKVNDESCLRERMRILMNQSPDKILFGSDWPMYQSLAEDIAFFEEMEFLTQEQKELFFYTNASRIIGA